MLIFVLSILCLAEAAKHATLQKHPDFGLNVEQMIRRYGYPFENHTVTTEDGYILDLHRIPHGRNDVYASGRPVAFLMPGVLCSSADWVNMGPTNSLGFILADNGYDVWLANYRGTRWGRRHVLYDPDKDKKEFWNFSFHEIGYYDVPAHIDYILASTGQEKLFYIGHSQGAVSFFVLNSLKPEYNDKIRMMGALSPPVYVSNSESIFIRMFNVLDDFIEDLISKHDFYEFLPYTRFLATFTQIFCNDDSPVQDNCGKILFAIAGDSDQLNKTMIPVIVSNTPAGSSIRQFQHFAQELISGVFRQFDHGEKGNLEKYGQLTPPEYDLSKVTAPVAIYYSDSDALVAAIDVKRTISELKNVVSVKLVEGFNHLDFMWAIDVVPLVFNDLLQLMRKY